MSAADHFRAVYRDGADDYHLLVSHEDAAGLLWARLDELVTWQGLDVVELGAGTGRVTVPLARRASTVRAFDAAPEMLRIAQGAVDDAGLANVELTVAEHRNLPLPDGDADALIEGWAVAHYVDWEPDTWVDALATAVHEMRRVVRAGGPLVLIETLGTGATEPRPPSPELAALYDILESLHGFSRTWVRTDYAFADAATAREVVARFFGADMVGAVTDAATLPECTGIWTSTA